MKDKKIKVLLVEDEEGDQFAFEDMVKGKNLPYSWRIASSVAETKNILAKQRFDVIIADYLLTDGTCFELFELFEDAPIIFVTGAGNENVAVKAMKAGVYDYVVKDQSYKYLEDFPVTIEGAYEHRQQIHKLKINSQKSVPKPKFEKLNVDEITEGINVFCAQFTAIGIKPLSYTPMKMFSSDEEVKRFVIYQSTYYLLALGQPDSAAEGIFGPLPMRGHPDKLSFLISYKGYDSTVAPILAETHAICVIFFPVDLEFYLPPRRTIREGIMPIIQEVSDLSEIPQNFASKIKEKVNLIIRSNMEILNL
ncbi:MAG: response regulator [Promethearchaeota archaeon]